MSFQQVNYADVFDRIVRDRTPEEEATAAVASGIDAARQLPGRVA